MSGQAFAKEWTIVPYVRFGPVRFGMGLQEVEAIIGTAPIRVDHPHAIFDIATIGFDGQGACNWIALDPRMARGRVVPVLEDGTRLVGGFDRVVMELSRRSSCRQGDIERGDEGSFYFDDAGVYLWRDDMQGQRIDALAAYALGYWPALDLD